MKKLGFVSLFLVVGFFVGCSNNAPTVSNNFVVGHEVLAGPPTFVADDFGNFLYAKCSSRCGEFYIPCSRAEVIVEPGIEKTYLSVYGKRELAILDIPIPSFNVEKAKIFVASPEAKLKLQKEGCERQEKLWF